MDWNTLWLPTATALGLALLHSIWIGALTYALVSTLLPFLRNAGHRHNLAYLGLLTLAVGFFVAFYQNFEYATVCENLEVTSISLSDLGLSLSAAAAPEKTGIEFLAALLPNLAPWVSLIYLFGLLPAAAYLLKDQQRVQYLRNNGLSTLPSAWSATISGELERHPATRRVKTYLSNHAGEVMTLGFWSPVIVFPVALINALSPEMARTILLHEIAHLRHYDHWLNYPQQFLRTLFFYHPVAHALCRIIDREREHRCDDWVAARCHDRRTYATALVTVARTSINPSNTLVMSATKTPFSNRIQRLFQGEEQRSGHAAFSLLFVSLLAVGHLSFTSLGADAGAVDCLEEQSKATLNEPAFNPVIIDTDGQEINIPLPEEVPTTTVKTKVPEVITSFLAKEEFFTARTAPKSANELAVSPLTGQTVYSLSVMDSLPPAPVSTPAKKSIVIRGAAKADLPLFILDGEVLDGTLDDYELDPAEIKSVSVFKGETAITRFGPQGANGVVDITTKNGAKATPKAKAQEPAAEEKKVVIGFQTEPTQETRPTVIVKSEFVEDEDAAKKPLLIVDGERVVGDLNTAVSSENIVAISVLKGSSATALYGEEGKNGVVLVTTKKGKAEGYVAPTPTGANTFRKVKKGKAKKELPASVIIESVSEAITLENDAETVSARIKYKSGKLQIDVDDQENVVVEGYPATTEPKAVTVVTGYKVSTTAEGEAVTITGQVEEAPAPQAQGIPKFEGPQQRTFTGENNPVTVFPNPSSGIINFKNIPTQEPLNVAVYTRFGEIVRQEKFNGSNINVEGLPTGNYLVVLTDGTQRWVNQVTITK